MPIADVHGRPLRNLRLSVTDRCNIRCQYCMPEKDYVWLPKEDILHFEEITKLVNVFVDLGVTKERLTGGEPLLRRDLPDLIRMLAAKPGLKDLALTTNGVLLAEQAQALHAAGLHRITVSLDTLRPDRFEALTRSRALPQVREGIEEASRLFTGLKLDAVVLRAVNDDELVALVEYAREIGAEVRFIEYMDVGNCNGWQPGQVVPAREIVARVSAEHALEALSPNYRGEVAARYRYVGTDTEIGIISSVTEPFCSACHRARLSADGRLFTCLFAGQGTDLRGPLRAGLDDEGLWQLLRRVWGARTDRYSDERAELLARGQPSARVEMSYIGG